MRSKKLNIDYSSECAYFEKDKVYLVKVKENKFDTNTLMQFQDAFKKLGITAIIIVCKSLDDVGILSKGR